MPSDPHASFDQGIFLVHLNRGRELFDDRKYREAEGELIQACRMRPTDETVLNLLGLTYYKQEKYREADKIYRKLTERNPGSGILHFNHGLVCFKLESLDRAESAFLRAVHLLPENDKVYFYLGNICEKKTRYKDAILYYRKAGANIMVKRVLSKIQATHRGEPQAEEGTGRTPPSPPESPPPEEPAGSALPSASDTSPGVDLKVTVDHIDKERFLTALKNSPIIKSKGPSPPAAEPRAISEKPESDTAELARIGEAPRTTVELSEPVVVDESLSQMSRRRSLSDATESLFAPLLQEDEKGSSSSDEDDTVDMLPITSGQVETGRQAPEEAGAPSPAKLEPGEAVFRHVEGNLMEINFSGKVFIKQGTIYSYSGNLTFWVKPQRHESTSPLVIVSGTGRLLLTDRQRRITVTSVHREEVFVEPSHLLACQETLTPRYGTVKRQGGPAAGFQILSVKGTGTMALSAATSPLILTVSPGYPVNVSSATIICWSGNLTPNIVEDETLSEMMSTKTGRTFNIRLEGTGRVMIEKSSV